MKKNFQQSFESADTSPESWKVSIQRHKGIIVILTSLILAIFVLASYSAAQMRADTNSSTRSTTEQVVTTTESEMITTKVGRDDLGYFVLPWEWTIEEVENGLKASYSDKAIVFIGVFEEDTDPGTAVNENQAGYEVQGRYILNGYEASLSKNEHWLTQGMLVQRVDIYKEAQPDLYRIIVLINSDAEDKLIFIEIWAGSEKSALMLYDRISGSYEPDIWEF